MKHSRTLLRPAGRSDAGTIVRWIEADAMGRARLRDGAPADEQALAEAIGAGRVNYVMVTTRDGEAVGFVEWRWSGQRVARCATIGVAVGDPGLWSLGYGAEAVDNVLEELFWTHGAHRVEFQAAVSNRGMVSMLSKAGAPVLEGVLRDYFFSDGEHEDALVWSVLRHEFDEASETLPDRAERRTRHRSDVERSSAEVARHVRRHDDTSLAHLLARTIDGEG